MEHEIYIINPGGDPLVSGFISGIPEDIFNKYKSDNTIWYWENIGKYVCEEFMSDKIIKSIKK